jgi:hypothetical protein
LRRLHPVLNLPEVDDASSGVGKEFFEVGAKVLVEEDGVVPTNKRKESCDRNYPRRTADDPAGETNHSVALAGSFAASQDQLRQS